MTPDDSQNSKTHSLVELRDLSDDAMAGGFSDSMEARFARNALGGQRIGLSLQKVLPGARSPFAHQHDQDEEIYVVVAGSGRAAVDGEVIDLRPWSALRVAPGAVRMFEADEDGLEFLAFGAHSEDDGKMLEPAWPSS